MVLIGTVVVAGTSSSDKDLRSLLEAWSAAGWLQRFLWISVASGGEVSDTVLIEAGECRHTTFEAFRTGEFHGFRVLCLQLLTSPSDQTAFLRDFAHALVAELEAGKAPQQTLVKIGLIVPDAPSYQMTEELVLRGWDVNAVASLEDRRDDRTADGGVAIDRNFIPHAALELVTALGLWVGSDEGPFDGRQPDSSQTSLVESTRSYARVVHGTLMVDRILGYILPQPGQTQFSPERAADLVGGIPARSEQALVERAAHDAARGAGEGVMQYRPPRPFVPPKPKTFSIGEILRTFFGYMRSRFQALPGEVADRVTNRVLERAENLVATLTVGTEKGAPQIRFAGRERLSDVSSSGGSQKPDDAASVVQEMLAGLRPGAAPVQAASPQLWRDLRSIAFGLADAGELPAFVSVGLQGPRREVIVDRSLVAPVPPLPALTWGELLGPVAPPGQSVSAVPLVDPWEFGRTRAWLETELMLASRDAALAAGQAGAGGTVAGERVAQPADPGSTADEIEPHATQFASRDIAELLSDEVTDEGSREPSQVVLQQIETLIPRGSLDAVDTTRALENALDSVDLIIEDRRRSFGWKIAEFLAEQLKAAIEGLGLQQSELRRASQAKQRLEEARKRGRRRLGLFSRVLRNFLLGLLIAPAIAFVVMHRLTPDLLEKWLPIVVGRSFLPSLGALYGFVAPAIGYLAGASIIVWFMEVVRTFRRDFRAQFKIDELELRRVHAVEQLYAVGSEYLRLNDLYDRLAPWNEAISWVLHRAAGAERFSGDQTLAAPFRSPARPLALGVGEGVATDRLLERNANRVFRSLFRPGWLSACFEQFAKRALEEDRLNRGLQTSASLEDIDSSLNGREVREVLRQLVDGSLSRAWVERLRKEVLACLSSFRPDDLFAEVHEASTGASGEGATSSHYSGASGTGVQAFLSAIYPVVKDGRAVGRPVIGGERAGFWTSAAFMEGAADVYQSIVWGPEMLVPAPAPDIHTRVLAPALAGGSSFLMVTARLDRTKSDDPGRMRLLGGGGATPTIIVDEGPIADDIG